MSVHEGHSKRLRERFRKEGLEGFQPHEVLELLLFYAKARGDLNPLAHSLLNEFGSLKGVLEASTDQLMSVDGVGPETATLLSLMVPMFRKYQEALCAEKQYLCHLPEAERYCRALMDGQRYERLYLISLSSSMSIVGQRMLGEGSIDEVPAYPRKVVEAALNHNAFAVILCHNHPGGIAEPSPHDVELTKNIEALLFHLGIKLVDHIIVAGASTYSMSVNGLLRRSRVKQAAPKTTCRESEQEYVWLDEGALD